MRHNWAHIGLASVVLPALMLAQGIDFTKLVPALSQELRDAAAPRFRYDSEFAVDRAVSAQPRNAIVFDSEAIDPAARFQLEAGSHKFCLDGGHEYFTGVIVEDDVRFPVPATIDREGCARVVVATGVYTVRPTHRAGARPVPKVATVLTADLPSPPLLNPDGKPRNGFWAVYPASTKNPEPEPGRLRAAPPYKQFDFFPQALPVVSDHSTTEMDEYSLFQLNFKSPAILAGPDTSVLNYGLLGGVFVLSGGDSRFLGYPVVMTDLKDSSRFKMRQTSDQSDQMGFDPWIIPGGYPENILSVQARTTPTFALVFRFFPDGTQVGTLYEGEVGLFQQPKFTGRAAVYPSSMPNIASLTSDATTIDKVVASIRLGPNTMVTLYPQPNYAGTPRALANNDESVDGITTVGSIRIGSLTAYMQSNHGCENCNFQGTDLSGLDLAGFSLEGANFARATLIRTKFAGAKLAGADFTGAKIDCTDFSGTDKDHRNDLTQTNFTNIQIASNACRVNFSYTMLSATTIPPRLWKLVNLNWAIIPDLKDKVLSSQAQPLDLAGAMLSGASLEDVILDYADLQTAVLDEAIMTGTHLTSAKLNDASLKHVNLQGAILQGAYLNHANLDGANLGGADLTKPPGENTFAADLTGAFLRNVNLTQGKISGANFTNANFYSAIAVDKGTCVVTEGFTKNCATATDATMDNTNFGGAYLFGVDFTHATAVGVIFQDSFLAGANFSSAGLSADISGQDTGFAGAFLQGTNLAGATLQNGIPLGGAFVDFSSEGNTVSLVLSGTHTLFAGYWGTPGTSVCARMEYGGPTTAPATDSTTTCPDGKVYSSGCGPANSDGSNTAWESHASLQGMASYDYKPTYPNPPDNTQVCKYDHKWIPK